MLEVSYVGNKSQNEWIDGGNGKVGDQNNVQPGGFFLPDPTRRLSPEAPPSDSSCLPIAAGLHQQHSGQ